MAKITLKILSVLACACACQGADETGTTSSDPELPADEDIELIQEKCASTPPPLASEAPSVADVGGTQPNAGGGDILDGLYFRTESRFYDGSFVLNELPTDTIQLESGTFLRRERTPRGGLGGSLESVTAGTYATSGTSVTFHAFVCVDGSASGNGRSNTSGYDASPVQLLIHRDGITDVFEQAE